VSSMIFANSSNRVSCNHLSINNTASNPFFPSTPRDKYRRQRRCLANQHSFLIINLPLLLFQLDCLSRSFTAGNNLKMENINEAENEACMVRGELYYAFTLRLVEKRARCDDTCFTFNQARGISRRERYEFWRESVISYFPVLYVILTQTG